MSNVDKTAKAPTVSVNGSARLYQIALAALTGVVVTGATAYVTEGRGHLNRAEVVEVVNTQSPFIRSQEQFQQLVTDMRDVRTQLSAQTAELAAMRAAVDANSAILRRQ